MKHPEGVGEGASVRVEPAPKGERLVFSGRLVVTEIERLQRQLPAGLQGPVGVDIAGVEVLDTAGAWLLLGLGAQGEIEVTGASARQEGLISAVRGNLRPPPRPPPRRRQRLLAWLDHVGRGTAEAASGTVGALGFLGLTLARIGRLALRPGRLRLTPLVHHMEATGLQAVPIVALMAFLIGVVLAFQGAVQLRQFGAEVFVVDLIAISVLRELGVLLTAVIVAGRSGAAFTAAIGSMKMREEVDALRVLGLDPVEVLVVPRVLALLLMLPALTLVAGLMGLVGGALMSWIELGVSPATFRIRLDEAVGVEHLIVGLVKAPVFALIIAVVGCQQGFAVKGNAESLGQRTSRSVVVSIFMVIVADALFSVFFALVGV